MKEKTKFPNAVNPSPDTGFPYYVRSADGGEFLPYGIGFGVLHWHDDLQFIYVSEGRVRVKTLEEEETLSAGEGIFVNSQVIHYSIGMSNPCRYRLFRFPKHFVSFYLGSPAEKLTQSITNNQRISLIPLYSSVTWGCEALHILKKLDKLEEHKDELYPYKVLTGLSQLWLIMLQNVKIPESLPDNITSLRMRTFLQYIEAHYAEDISLEALAMSANVSKSETLRCFKQTLQTTPYRYLMDYRLSKAGDLLKETDLTIGRIADLAGFHQQSYFGKVFRDRTGMSPREYRAEHKNKRHIYR